MVVFWTTASTTSGHYRMELLRQALRCKPEEATMAAIAIQILWALIGFIVLCGVIWLALYIIQVMTGTPVPDRIQQGIWLIVLLLALIFLLTALVGGGVPWARWFHAAGESGATVAALSPGAADHSVRWR
jgi:hypothetical protein